MKFKSPGYAAMSVQKALAFGPVYTDYLKLWQGAPITLDGRSAEPKAKCNGGKK